MGWPGDYYALLTGDKTALRDRSDLSKASSCKQVQPGSDVGPPRNVGFWTVGDSSFSLQPGWSGAAPIPSGCVQNIHWEGGKIMKGEEGKIKKVGAPPVQVQIPALSLLVV